MRLTTTELAIITYICNAKEKVTYKCLIAQTSLNFTRIVNALQKMIQAGRIEAGVSAGFVITKLTKKNPVVRLLLQEIAAEKSWQAETQYPFRWQQFRQFIHRNKYMYTWAGKIKRLVIKIAKKK